MPLPDLASSRTGGQGLGDFSGRASGGQGICGEGHCIGGIPHISSLSPTSIVEGTISLIVTIIGINFRSDSTVYFSGEARLTIFISDTELRAVFLTEDLIIAGTFEVSVVNPSPGCGGSSAVIFSVTPIPLCEGGIPVITSLSPFNATVGDSGFTLTLNGINFRADSIVFFADNARTTTFINTTQLTIELFDADLVSEGTFSVVVNNPPPGCGYSNTVFFTVLPLALPSAGPAIIGNGSIHNRVNKILLPYGGHSITPPTSLTWIAPIGGYLKNLVTWTSSIQSAVHTTTIFVTKSGVTTDLAISYPPNTPAGLKSDFAHQVHLAQGEGFNFKIAITGDGPGIETFYEGITCEFATDDGSMILGGQPRSAVMYDLSTRYFGIGSNVSGFVEATFPFRCLVPGTVKNLVVQKLDAEGSHGDLIITLRKNLVDQAVTITIPSGTPMGNDTWTDLVHNFHVNEGDMLSVAARYTGSSGASATINNFQFCLLPDAEVLTQIVCGFINTVLRPANFIPAWQTAGALFENLPYNTTHSAGGGGLYTQSDVPMPHAGTAKKLWIQAAKSAIISGITIYELIIDGVASGLKVTMPAGTPVGWYGNNIDTAAISAGQVVRLQNTGINSGGLLGTWEFELEVF